MVVQHALLKLEVLEASSCVPCARMVCIYCVMILSQPSIQQSILFVSLIAEPSINLLPTLTAAYVNV
jgi:hypothetical protein